MWRRDTFSGIPLALLAAALLGSACTAAKPGIYSGTAGASPDAARHLPPPGPGEPEGEHLLDADAPSRADQRGAAHPDNAAAVSPVEIPEIAPPETVAVVPARYEPDVRIVRVKQRSRLRAAGENALIGTVVGALIPLAVVETITPPGGADAWERTDWEAIGAATAGGAILGALGGFGYGLFAPLGTEQEESASLAGGPATIVAYSLQEELGRSVAARAQAGGKRPVLVLDDVGPASPSEQPDYMPLLLREIGAVVETAITRIAIRSDGPSNDSYTASFAGLSRRIDTATGTVEREEPFDVRLGSLPLAVWQEDGCAALKSAIGGRLPELASRIVDALVPPPGPTPASPPGRSPEGPARQRSLR